MSVKIKVYSNYASACSALWPSSRSFPGGLRRLQVRFPVSYLDVEKGPQAERQIFR